MHRIDSELRECIELCRKCQDICLETIQHCLEIGGKHAAADHLRLLISCAEICDTSAKFMLLGSTLHNRVCDVCAMVCDACAGSCDRLATDETMRQCAAECRRCAESCRQMATTRHHA